ncbi:ArnT family glycosyltransferase, partial [Limnofasciculus baicalensis]
ALEAALGLAAMLTMSHLLGQVGLLHGIVGLVVSLAIAVAGIGRGVVDGVRWRKERANRAVVGRPTAFETLAKIACGIPLGVTLFAIVNPPGVLWGSEFGGYDALSYHLQLPQEWLANGRLAPVEHNVYSFLPGYMEAAFLHIAAMSNAPTSSAFPHGPMGLLAGDGWRVIACQALHAGVMVLASWLCGVLGSRAAMARGASEERARAAGWCAALLVLFTPWSIVVGTLAYNEMALVAMIAGAMIVAVDGELSPVRRGVLSGVLIGAACGAKPTALLFAGVPTGLVLLGMMPLRQWWRAAVFGASAGLIMLLPWMVRNCMACGNPLFPFALTKYLGTAHWSAEQVANFLQHHVSNEPLMDRVKLLALPDANDPAASAGRAVYRGMSHPQWGVLFLISLASITHALFWVRGRGRLLAALLSAGVFVQVVLWLTTTHVQSRFLMPMLVPCVALVALAFDTPVAGEGKPGGLRHLSRTIMNISAVAVIAVQCGFLVWTVQQQRGGTPTALMPLEPADFTSDAWHRETDPVRRERLVASSAAIGVAALVPAGERVLLLGEGAPFCFPADVKYNVVWDRWPFADGELTDLAAKFVLVDLGSIARYERSGYLPKGVSVRAVQEWMVRRTRGIRQWEGEGKVLVEVIGER